MPWPTLSVSTTELDADSDNPRLARPSLKDIADFVNAVAVGDVDARALLGVSSTAEMNAAITAGVNEAKAYTDSKYYPMRRQVVTRGGVYRESYGLEYSFVGGLVYSYGSTDAYEFSNVSISSSSLPSETKRVYFYKEKDVASLKLTDYPPVYYSTNGYSEVGQYLNNRAYMDQIGFSWIFNFENLSTSSTPSSVPGTEEFGHYNDLFNTGLYDMQFVGPVTSNAWYGDTTRFKFGSRSLRIEANNVALELIPSRKWMPSESWIIDGHFNFSILPGSGAGKTLFSIENKAGTFDVAKLRIENASGVIKLRVYLSSNGSSYDIVSAGAGTNTSFTAGQWYHIGLRYNAETDSYSILFNGTRDYILTGAAKKVFSQIGKIRIANDRTVGTSGFLGNIDGLSILPCASYNVDTTYTVPTTAPSREGCFFYDYNSQVMNWKDNTPRVFVGEMISTSSSSLVSYKPYARSEYNIDDIAASTNYQFTHGLGYRPGLVSVMGLELPDGDYGQVTQHVYVGEMDTTKATIRIMGTPLIIDPEQSTTATPIGLRVILDRGW